MRHIAGILSLLCALVWAGVSPAQTLTHQLGTLVAASASSPQYLPTSADAAAGTAIIVGAGISSTTLGTATDSSGNTYSAATTYNFTGSDIIAVFYSSLATDLPAPCTVTGTIATTVLTISAIGTCGSGSTTNPNTLVAGDVITGTSVTANSVISSVASAWNGTTGSYNLSQSSTVSTPETVTSSSAIKLTYTGTRVQNAAAINVSGLVSSSLLDVTGAGAAAATASNSIATGALGCSTEIIIGEIGAAGSFSAYSSNSPFTSLTGPSTAGSSPNFAWGYDIVSSTASVTYAPSWTTARTNGANVWSFKGSACTAAPKGNPSALNLTGVGP